MKEFETSDLYQAAYFAANEFPIKRLEKKFGRVFFIFDADDDDWEEIKMSWFGAGMVHAQTYAQKIKDCKFLAMNAMGESK